MATSAIQQSSFAGQTALKPSSDLIQKVGVLGGGRVTMRRTVKSTPQSIWYQIYPLSLLYVLSNP